jgi:hypothetical protein
MKQNKMRHNFDVKGKEWIFKEKKVDFLRGTWNNLSAVLVYDIRKYFVGNVQVML